MENSMLLSKMLHGIKNRKFFSLGFFQDSRLSTKIDCEWADVVGCWLVLGAWCMVVGAWWMVVCVWLMVAGLFLVVCDWWFGVGGSCNVFGGLWLAVGGLCYEFGG